MSRTSLRCDARRSAWRAFVTFGKCGKSLAVSPLLGEHVQWTIGETDFDGEVWLVDYNRHVASVHVMDRAGVVDRAHSETIAWTALRPCNWEPLR